MIYSLTDKLKFDTNPQLQIGEVVVTVNADAMTVLSLMDIINNSGELEGAIKAGELLFSEEDREKIAKLNLNVTDYMTLISTAVTLATGGDPYKEAPAGEE